MKYNYFCFEGPDFSGKSSIMTSVFQNLFELNSGLFLKTKEPGSPYSQVCIKIRDILQHSEIKDEFVYAGLFDIDRRIHLKEVVAPAIENKKIILSDRCIISSKCYQENEIVQLRTINDEFFMSLKPYIFFITADKDTLLSRSSYREMTTIENNVFASRLDNILKKYEEIVKEYDHEIIYNPNCDEDQFKSIIDYITSRIVKLSMGILI